MRTKSSFSAVNKISVACTAHTIHTNCLLHVGRGHSSSLTCKPA